MKLKLDTVMVLSLILGIVLGYFLISEIVMPGIEKQKLQSYDQGVQQGKIDVVYQQTTQGIIYYINESRALDSMSLNDLCAGVGGNQ